MPLIHARFKNVLVMTPEGCDGYIHTRALRKRCDSLVEFNFIEMYKRLGIVETRRSISRIIAEKKIDVFFVTFYADSYLVPVEFLIELKKSVKIVLACYDDESAFDLHSKYYAQAADAVVTTDYFSVAAYQALGVPAILCLNSVSRELFPVLDLPKDIDVSFVGNCGKTDRKEYVDFLFASGIKVESYGFGSSNGFIPNSEVPKIFNRSKINLSFSRLENPTADKTMGHKGRTIEVAMTRSFCLSEYYPALPHIFEIGKELDCFTDRQTLLEKVRYYLSHDEERERVAASAYARALREYEEGPSFDAVMSGLNVAFAGARRPAAFQISPEFKARQIADLFVHALSLLLHGRLGACGAMASELFQHGPAALLAGVAGGVGRGLDILRRKIGAWSDRSC